MISWELNFRPPQNPNTWALYALREAQPKAKNDLYRYTDNYEVTVPDNTDCDSTESRWVIGYALVVQREGNAAWDVRTYNWHGDTQSPPKEWLKAPTPETHEEQEAIKGAAKSEMEHILGHRLVWGGKSTLTRAVEDPVKD